MIEPAALTVVREKGRAEVLHLVVAASSVEKRGDNQDDANCDRS
jgi:hypothetical protein